MHYYRASTITYMQTGPSASDVSPTSRCSGVILCLLFHGQCAYYVSQRPFNVSTFKRKLLPYHVPSEWIPEQGRSLYDSTDVKSD